MIALLAAGCGEGGADGGSGGAKDGVEPRILTETLTRDARRQLDDDVEISGCANRSGDNFTCLARGPAVNAEQTQFTVMLDDGRYRAVASSNGAAVDGLYPRDTDYRGMDLDALSRAFTAAAAKGTDLFEAGTPANEPPDSAEPRAHGCELEEKDRTYDCEIVAVVGGRGVADDSFTVTMRAKGTFTAERDAGTVGGVQDTPTGRFTGRLPASLK